MIITIPLSILVGILIAVSVVLGFGLCYFINEGVYILPLIFGILIVMLIVIGVYLC